MKAQELRETSTEDLNVQLLGLLREQFNLRLQISSGQVKTTHMLKQLRRDAARIKTVLASKEVAQ